MDTAGVTERIEAALPVGVRRRQLAIRTLLVGIVLTQHDHRPAHLSRIHQALTSLPETDQRRLGVVCDWKTGTHQLTYRQCEYTFDRLVGVLAKDAPDGEAAQLLCEVIDALVEASVPAEYQNVSRSLALDWTDHATFSRPPAQKGGQCADREASWGRRKCDEPGRKDELFFGYELQVATMVAEETGPAVPELARRILITSCHLDPPTAFVATLERLVGAGTTLGDLLVDSGYAHRTAGHFAAPVRRLGARLVMDLHPHDRGPHGTHKGAICHNGNLYCPATPRALFNLGPLARGATADETTLHDTQSGELSRYKLGRQSADDLDGYHRVTCPAVTGKLRCPLRPASLALPHSRPEVLAPPEHPPTCCTQQTLTVPATVNAKTRQKHDYPSAAHRLSYARRSAAERANSTTKDRASIDFTRGWCRLMGLTANTVMAACGYLARNLRIADAFAARQADAARRLARGLPPKTRRRRRTALPDLTPAAAQRPP